MSKLLGAPSARLPGLVSALFDQSEIPIQTATGGGSPGARVGAAGKTSHGLDISAYQLTAAPNTNTGALLPRLAGRRDNAFDPVAHKNRLPRPDLRAGGLCFPPHSATGRSNCSTFSCPLWATRPSAAGQARRQIRRGSFGRLLKIERKSQRVFQSQHHVNGKPANLAFKAHGW
jgi:hypothetical protein